MATAQEFQDGRSYDPQSVRNIRQEWVDQHMKEKESEFTTTEAGRVFCGTWNVNGKKLDGDLSSWLLPHGEERADLYAIGFQEMVDLNAMNVAIDGGKAKGRSEFWCEKSQECLDSTGTKYSLVMEKHLVGLLILIYVKTSVVSKVKDVRATSTGVGLLGMMGNKGAVAVRMSFQESSLCFVCTHLAAHRGAVSARNSDFKAIIDRTVFTASVSDLAGKGDGEGWSGDSSTAASSSATDMVVKPRHGSEKTRGVDQAILDHDFVFWIGDLNYRIDEELSTDEVFSLLDAGNINFLRDRDQLNIERARRNVFQEFHEGLLEFLPTYKYQPGTDDYDRRPEKKLRPPAWCDRILWRTAPGVHGADGAGTEAVRLLSYRRSELNPSDHKPVSASFSIDLRVVVTDKEKAVFEQLRKLLAAHANTELPKVEVDVEAVPLEFSGVRYLSRAEKPYTIKNVGKSLAYWRFVNKTEDVRPCKRWASVSQSSGLLLPGESKTLFISVIVDRLTSQAVNTGKEILTDVLQLRVENSFDVFTPIEVEFLRSAYGMSLEELVMAHEPVRRTYLPAHRRDRRGDDDDGNVSVPAPEDAPLQKLGIPKELWRLADALWSGKALQEKDLFQAVADPVEVSAIREAIDCGVDFPPNCSPHAYVEALSSLLAALPKPLLPPDLYPATEVDEATHRQACKRFLDALPPLSYNVFVYMISFLREVLAQQGYNRTSADKLALVCLGCMTPPAEEGRVDERRISALRELLTVLLTASSL